MPMRDIEPIMDGERTVLLETIQTRIKYIIQSVEVLLDNDGILQIAGALYIHAVEEYGKYLYVQNLPSNSGIVNVEKSPFRGHNFKIELARKNVPADCFVLQQGSFTSTGFTRDSFNVHEVPDWQTRLTIFNTDLEEGRVPQLPGVDSADLRKAVNAFKSHVGHLTLKERKNHEC